MSRLRVVVLLTALSLAMVTVVPVGVAGAADAEGTAYPPPGRTERVSVATDGAEGNSRSQAPAIGADGRYVAFRSDATNLVPGDENRSDVFVHDRDTGATELVSVASDGTQANSAAGRVAAISADGRHVVFDSFASNLVPGDTNGAWDIFVHDRETGATELVSVASDGAQGDGAFEPAISADGRHVAFASRASNLVPGDTNGTLDVFVHDRETRATERVSVASDGAQGDRNSRNPAISADGRYVAFDSTASNLVPDDTNDTWDVFVHDRQTGATELVSLPADGIQGSWDAAISADGRHVAFTSFAKLVPEDTNGDVDVFVHDRETGATERVSVASDGAEVNGPSAAPAISADGRHVTFRSLAPSLVPGDSNGAWDVFVHDRETGATERVAVASDGSEANGQSVAPAISADGRHVTFEALATNLVPGDANERQDVFVRDRGPAIGIGGLAVQVASDELTVSGWARFAGAIISSGEDPGDDGEDSLGAEITRASVTSRPQHGDLLVNLRLTSLPDDLLIDDRSRGVVYRWAFTAADTAYEVRAMRTTDTTDPPWAYQHFALYECTLVCTETTRLSGGIGTAGTQVRVSVPLAALGAEEGITLTNVAASVGLGEAAPGQLVPLDHVALPDASVFVPRIDLGIAPASTSQADVAFTTQAELVEGRFNGTLDASSFSAGDLLVWARACLGEACGALATPPPEPPVVIELDDADPAIEYRRGWHRREDDAASHGGYHRRLGSPGGGEPPTARLVFEGHQITYFFGVSEQGGTADVFLDGELARTVDYSGAAPANSPELGHTITLDALGEGSHEILIVHRSGAVYVDGFEIVSGEGGGA